MKDRSVTELSAFYVIFIRNGILRRNTTHRAPKKMFAVIKISIMAAATCRLRMTVTGCQYYSGRPNEAERRRHSPQIQQSSRVGGTRNIMNNTVPRTLSKCTLRSALPGQNDENICNLRLQSASTTCSLILFTYQNL